MKKRDIFIGLVGFFFGYGLSQFIYNSMKMILTL